MNTPPPHHRRRGQPLNDLLQELTPLIYRFALKRCRSAHDAEDITQETLIVLLRRLPTLTQRGELKGWVVGVARNLCLKRLARRASAPEASLDELTGEALLNALLEVSAFEPAEGGSTPETLTLRALEWRRVQEAIERLPLIFREALTLRDVEGLSATETAQALGLSLPALKSRLHRARAELRASLGAPNPTPTRPRPLAPRACPDVRRLFSEFLEGELSSHLCAQMEAHVEGCEACGAECDALKRTLGVCSAARARLPEALERRLRASVSRWLSSMEDV
jgi:RNA polymerase sigma-70 factor (ECF subfamily)